MLMILPPVPWARNHEHWGAGVQRAGTGVFGVGGGARWVYSEGKRGGAQKAFPVASLRGVEVRASRLLTSDEVMLSLSIPCRTGRCTRRTSLAARPMASVWCDASRTWLTRSLPTVRSGCRRNLLRLRHRMTLPIDNIIHICEHLSLC